ncbi:uncharacterized protein LY79DRAFT_539878 [Colletotrichum navitas]|uniref:Uncharacterized protein n=1 Tax=Colletotrichum navitas TaxID=681940 RepID=A0AAD8V898_9PEZI|nr:uncharacterized protein LY79DRAFT_539878 [Colletotrichum navitas]KAK1597992.1 hypothetical protein LY79DRAFT_539878 [Colletotrichum navitas]
MMRRRDRATLCLVYRHGPRQTEQPRDSSVRFCGSCDLRGESKTWLRYGFSGQAPPTATEPLFCTCTRKNFISHVQIMPRRTVMPPRVLRSKQSKAKQSKGSWSLSPSASSVVLKKANPRERCSQPDMVLLTNKTGLLGSPHRTRSCRIGIISGGGLFELPKWNTG